MDEKILEGIKQGMTFIEVVKKYPSAFLEVLWDADVSIALTDEQILSLIVEITEASRDDIVQECEADGVGAFDCVDYHRARIDAFNQCVVILKEIIAQRHNTSDGGKS